MSCLARVEGVAARSSPAPGGRPAACDLSSTGQSSGRRPPAVTPGRLVSLRVRVVVARARRARQDQPMVSDPRTRRPNLRSVPTGSAVPGGGADATADEPFGDSFPERLAGRTALVTGAGSPDGIGYATARRLRAMGANVAIVSTTRRIHERAGELGVTGFVADLTVEAEVGALADAITEQLGTVDIVVNNAGLASKASPEVLRPVAQLTYDEWRAEIDRNLSTAFLVSRAFVGGMA